MVNTKKGSRLAFVGGAPRSGTTLVQNMLDSHPDVCGGPEFFCVTDIIKLRQRLHRLIAKGWIDVFCSHEDVDRILSSQVESFLLPLADRLECKLLSEKTPANVLIFSELLDLLPGARFIHVVRDPRATIASMLTVGQRAKRQGWKTQDYTHRVSPAIRLVRRSLNAGFVASRKDPRRVLTLTYEELVSAPESETQKICDFLGIEWSKQMMYPGRFDHLGEKAITNNVWYTSDMYNRNPETNEIDKWKTQLSLNKIIAISKSFNDDNELTQIGYDLSLNDLSAIGRLLVLAYAAERVVQAKISLRHKLSFLRKSLQRLGI